MINIDICLINKKLFFFNILQIIIMSYYNKINNLLKTINKKFNILFIFKSY